jgi:glycosyltransferase involved in cell wall biosynthesis
MEKILTVFTPTYNRGYILHRCYESLKNQTSKQFVWIIVDDGSTDNTYEIVNEWIKEGEIEIRYYQKPNGGKSSAHNMGVDQTTTHLFVCVDSDDYLTDDAIMKVIEFWNENNDNKAAGVVALKGDIIGNPLGTCLPKEVVRSTLYDLYNRHGHKGDAMLIYRSEILKQYPFPQIDGEKFVPEAYLYDQVDANYDLLLLNEVLYKCEYLQDGYTHSFKKVILQNPKGYSLFYAHRMTIAHNFYLKYRSAALYILGNLLAGNLNVLKHAPRKFMTIAAFPAGLLIYMIKYKCGKFKF